MSAMPSVKLSEAEYLAMEEKSEIKHEYYRGEVFAMAGASPEHDLVIVNTVSSLHTQLRRRPCRIYSSDVRVRVSQTGLYTYPDASVVCGEAEFTIDKPSSLLNPTLIIEVLSPSTEAYDRGMKFSQYRTLESLQKYVLISQDEAHIERYLRQADGTWNLQEAKGLETSLALKSIDCVLALADVYEGAEFITEKLPPPVDE